MLTRKKFIKELSVISAGVLVGCSLALDGCTNVRSIDGALRDNKISIPKSEFTERDFVVIRKSKEIAFPIYVSKTGIEGFTALKMLCTHKRCELRPAGNLLSCPCHGSDFSNTGKVLSPPANTDLESFKVTSDEENVYVFLS
ncbi:MAG: Rieske (2Fe-2S) protein [Candidatus Kapaibacterium sp.]|nr:Rieske (2Fe-2S) protein [Bacteroidota bacterium]